MAAIDEFKPKVDENKYVRPGVIASSEVGKSSGARPGISQPSRATDEVEISVQDLLMLEFPLPKGLWQNNKDTNRCASCNNRFRRIGQGGRHHCRVCGKCVCAICSVNKLRGYRLCINCKKNPTVQERFPELMVNKAMALELKLPETKPKYEASEKGESDPLPAEQVEEYKIEPLEHFPSGGSLCYSPRPRHSKKWDSQSVTSDFRRNSTLVRPSVDLRPWKTVHCVSWIKSLGLNESEEKTIAAIKELGLCGSDLQGISDSDLQSELKIYSAILRRRILRSLEQLTQEVVDKILKQDEENTVLSQKDLSQLVRDVQILKRGSFPAADRIVMLNSPENKFQVEWYATSIQPGTHKVTVIDQNNIRNSSYWILKHQGNAIVTHCLSTNPSGLRWRFHNATVEVCTNNNSDELNTDLVISLQSVTFPKSRNG